MNRLAIRYAFYAAIGLVFLIVMAIIDGGWLISAVLAVIMGLLMSWGYRRERRREFR